MKKLINTILTIFACFSMSGCNGENNTNSDIIFSEIIEGSLNNRAIELYNRSDKEVNLNNYSLEIQLTNGNKTLQLEGSVLPCSTFTIVYSDADDELKGRANQISEELMFNGSQPIKLKKGNKEIDILSTWDYQIDYCKDITLVRKEEYLVGRKIFEEYDWIRYNKDNYKYLGTIKPSLTEEELLAGPKLTEEDLSRPYYIKDNNNNLIGGGGVMNVTVRSYVDGDTTCFNYDKTIIDAMGIKQGTKMRYQNINTPESYAGNVQEFGLVAKAYTNDRLSSSFNIQVQSVLNGSLTETFDRLLGWVWVDGELLNNTIVKMGYSNLEFNSIDIMTYKDVSYSNFLYNSELYARKHGRGIHGEKDPYWDYENNRVKSNISGVNPNK